MSLYILVHDQLVVLLRQDEMNSSVISILIRPEKCSDYLYTLMSKCLAHEATERPTFGDILNMLANDQIQYEEFITSYEVPQESDTN